MVPERRAVRGRSSVAAATFAIAHAQALGDGRLAYRQFIQLADDLAAVDPATRVALSYEEPERTGTRWDDAVAALVEYRLTQAGAPLPRWVLDREGNPSDVWEPDRSAAPFPLPPNLDKAAEPFRRRGIAIEDNELSSA